jgi:hypothetical protein
MFYGVKKGTKLVQSYQLIVLNNFDAPQRYRHSKIWIE